MLASTIDFPILSMLVVVPFVGALLVLLLSRRRPEYMRLVAGTAASVLTSMFRRASGNACSSSSSVPNPCPPPRSTRRSCSAVRRATGSGRDATRLRVGSCASMAAPSALTCTSVSR